MYNYSELVTQVTQCVCVCGFKSNLDRLSVFTSDARHSRMAKIDFKL